MFPHGYFPASYYAPAYYAPVVSVVTSGGSHSYTPFVSLAELEALARQAGLKVNHGEPRPELNRPRLEQDGQERERVALEALLADEEDVVLMLV